MLADQPAFPLQPGEVRDPQGVPFYNCGQAGLTKREYFAAMAMQGSLASMQDLQEGKMVHPEDVATVSVGYADALLAALEESK